MEVFTKYEQYPAYKSHEATHVEQGRLIFNDAEDKDISGKRSNTYDG